MIHTLTRFITQDQFGLYRENGWKVQTFKGDTSGVTRVMTTTQVDFFGTQPTTDDLIRLLVKPQLVQRANIKRPLGKFTTGLFLDSLSFDFMSFDLSMKADLYRPDRIEISMYRIMATLFAYKLSRFEGFNVEEKGRAFALRIFHPFDNQQYEMYCKYLLQIRSGQLQLSDLSGLEGTEGLPKAADFWWDLDNDVLLTFDKNYAFRLVEMLRTTQDHLGHASGP